MPRYPTRRFASSVHSTLTRFTSGVALLVGLTVSAAKAEDRYCFENAGLKYQDTVRFSVSANRIAKGEYTRAPYDEETAKTMKFTGTKTGTVLTIQPKGKVIYEKAKGEEIIMWSLKKQTLNIPMYGKNHTTGKHSNYDAAFVKCKP